MKSLGDMAVVWPQLNLLLDQALELPPPEREGWLQALPEEHAALKDTLARLLQTRAAAETRDFLGTLPKMDGAAAMALASPDAASPLAGDMVGPYRLLRGLGEGGMGTVWLAERADGALKRQVALKLPRLAWARGLADRMARERDILASLEHPLIARLYDAGIDQFGRPYLALEYLEGRPIDVAASEQGLSTPQKIGLLLQVCEAVAFAHSRLVVHRDLKPSNILVTDDGQVRLLDFGIAKLMQDDQTTETQLTLAVGRPFTPDYASPEQIRGEPIGTASDVYSLGVVAYELLAGQRPYRLKRQSAAALEEAIVAADVPLASTRALDETRRRALRGDLDAILGKALKPLPQQRYATVREFADDLGRALRNEPVLARPDTLAYRAGRFLNRHRLPVGIAGLVFVALSAVATTALLQREEARKEAARARAVQGFLEELFVANNGPRNRAEAQRTTARELLDRGKVRLAESLKDQPEARYELLWSLANIYWNLELWDEAEAVEAQRVEAARELFGPKDSRLAMVLINHAETLRNGARRDRVPALLVEAEQVLMAAGEATGEYRAGLYAAALQYWTNQSLPEALKTADDGLTFMLRHRPQSNRRIVADMYSAPLRAQLGEFGRAVDEARRSVEAARALTGPEGPTWSRPPMGVLADLLQTALRLPDAETWMRDHLKLTHELQGVDSTSSLVAEVKLGNLLQELGKMGEAEPLHRRAEQALRDSPPWLELKETSWLRMLLALRMLERGRPDLLITGLSGELEQLKLTLPLSPRRLALLLAQARAQAATGQFAAAESTLATARQVWQTYAAGARAPATEAALALATAELAMAQRQPQAAVEALRDVGAAAGPRADVGAALLRGRALLALGRGDEAAKALAAAQAVQSRVRPSALPIPVLADMAQLEGRLLMSQGQPVPARQALQRALDLRRTHDLPGSLHVAALEAALAAASRPSA